MKIYMRILMPALCALIMLPACGRDEDPVRPGGTELVLAPSVDGGSTRAAVNYSADQYLTLPGYGQADVTVGIATAAYEYDQMNNELRATGDPFLFPNDGSALTFRVQWPTAAKRQTLGTALPKDQSLRETFLAWDFLSATVTAFPSSKIPVSLAHEHSKAAFTLEGTSFYGRRIEKLVFNGYTAYCDPARNDAQLIFKPLMGQQIFAAGGNGALRVEGDGTMYTFTLASPVTGFDSGSHHTIKLNVQN